MNTGQSHTLLALRPKTIFTVVLPLVVSIVLLNGCNDPSSNDRPAYVVVDMVSVARALGRDATIQNKLKDANALLSGQLEQIGTSLQEYVNNQRSKLKGSKDRSNQEKIDDLEKQSQLKFRESQLLAQKRSDEFRSKLLLEFRDEVRRTASEIAKRRGVQSVRVAGNDLLWYDPSIDITAEVIKVLRASDRKNETSDLAPKNQEQRSDSAEQIDQLNQLMDEISEKEPSVDPAP